MFYLMKGKINDEYGGSFEWVVEADSIEAAKAQLEQGQALEEIHEISVEERIDREKKELCEAVKRNYLDRRFRDRPALEYFKYLNEMESEYPEMYYIALKEFNIMQRLTKRLSRRNGFEKVTIAQFFDLVNKLIDAKDEEEFNSILRSLDD
ncbi:MAG TPA: hypothetical protein DD415_04085 [Clostridiales bacterium]|nr:hypothetical protein [Clostridiales bacterium]